MMDETTKENLIIAVLSGAATFAITFIMAQYLNESIRAAVK